jgi:oligopeptidase B
LNGRYIKSYSPYENIKKQNYPELFITTSINDARVGYWEPAKFVAKLRENKTDHNKLIFKINLNTGHVGAFGKIEHLQEIADDYIFIYQALGMAK